MARRRGWGVLGALVLVLAGHTAGASAASRPTGPSCTRVDVAVSLADGLPADAHVVGELCRPRRPLRGNAIVQVLVHGYTYGSGYWDFPDPAQGTDRYSYTDHAVRSGAATFRFDRLGSGASSRPPSALVTIDTGVWVLHQLVAHLREAGFEQVVTVGHSFGSAIAWLEASRHHDVDGLIITGATHTPATDNVATGLFPLLYPAMAEPRFAGSDPGYLTTRPGTRGWFYAPAPADPAVVALDEATKEAGTASELATVGAAFGEPLDIRVPVLVAAGERDPVVCGGSLAHPECADGDALAASEAAHLGTNVPCVDGYLLDGGGHVINLLPNAGDWFVAANRWVLDRIQGDDPC